MSYLMQGTLISGGAPVAWTHSAPDPNGDHYPGGTGLVSTASIISRFVALDAGGGADLNTLFPTTLFDGSSDAGWTSVSGNGVATIEGSFSLSMVTFALNVSSLFLGSGGQHPKHYRSIASLLGPTGDWSVTARIESLTGDRMCLSLNDDAESGGIIAFVEANGRVGLVTDWSNGAEIQTGTGACPLDETGYVGLRSRGGNITGIYGTGTALAPPTAWKTIETGTPRVRVPLTRLSLYLAAPSALGTAASIADVRVRTGL